MEYIGKKIVRYGDLEFIGDEYRLEIDDKSWNRLLSVANEKQLNRILEDQLRFDNYEKAIEVVSSIDRRFKENSDTKALLS